MTRAPARRTWSCQGWGRTPRTSRGTWSTVPSAESSAGSSKRWGWPPATATTGSRAVPERSSGWRPGVSSSSRSTSLLLMMWRAGNLLSSPSPFPPAAHVWSTESCKQEDLEQSKCTTKNQRISDSPVLHQCTWSLKVEPGSYNNTLIRETIGCFFTALSHQSIYMKWNANYWYLSTPNTDSLIARGKACVRFVSTIFVHHTAHWQLVFDELNSALSVWKTAFNTPSTPIHLSWAYPSCHCPPHQHKAMDFWKCVSSSSQLQLHSRCSFVPTWVVDS